MPYPFDKVGYRIQCKGGWPGGAGEEAHVHRGVASTVSPSVAFPGHQKLKMTALIGIGGDSSQATREKARKMV